RRGVELVDISILRGSQQVQRAAKAKILGIMRSAMRRVEDQGHFRRLWVAPPQHTGDLEAHPYQAPHSRMEHAYCREIYGRFGFRASGEGRPAARCRRDEAPDRVQDDYL